MGSPISANCSITNGCVLYQGRPLLRHYSSLDSFLQHHLEPSRFRHKPQHGLAAERPQFDPEYSYPKVNCRRSPSPSVPGCLYRGTQQHLRTCHIQVTTERV